jgi:hypothetical protein
MIKHELLRVLDLNYRGGHVPMERRGDDLQREETSELLLDDFELATRACLMMETVLRLELELKAIQSWEIYICYGRETHAVAFTISDCCFRVSWGARRFLITDKTNRKAGKLLYLGGRRARRRRRRRHFWVHRCP